MSLKKLGYAAVVAIAAAGFVIGSAGSSEAKGKKKPAPAPKISATCLMSAAAPVCATRGGQTFTYRNACYAGNDGAVVKSDKACPAKKAVKAKKKGKKAAKKAGKKK